MILSKEKEIVNTNISNIEHKEFTIKTSAKAFKILSSQLYSDKIKSVIRELVCNAWDSHIAAKQTEPFIIHLPSKIEPYFSVQDFGVGMSHEGIMDLYSTYFESDKTWTNDQIGAYGLGSKAPFSYTNSFNVESVYDFKRTFYTMIINENGIPTVNKINTLPTNDHNGITVKFAVKENDFEDFLHKTVRVVRIFGIPPKVIGNDEYENLKQSLTTVLSGDNWKYCTTNFYANDRAVVLQGNVEYPIEEKQLGKLTEKQLFVANNKFYINFNIGDIDVTASRENIEYTEETKKLIKERLTEIYDSFIVNFKQDIKSCKTLWEARCTVVNIANKLGFTLRNLEHIDFKWNETKFKAEAWVIFGLGKVHISEYKLRINHQLQRKNHFRTQMSIKPNNSVGFVRLDEELGNVKKNRKLRKIFSVTNKEILYVSNDFNNDIVNKMGNPEIINISTVQEDVIMKKANTQVKNHNCYYLLHNVSQTTEALPVHDVAHYYVNFRNYKLIIPGTNQEISRQNVEFIRTFLDMHHGLNESKLLYAVKSVETNTKRFKMKGWIDFISYARKLAEKFIKDNYQYCTKCVLANEIRELLLAIPSYITKIMMSEFDKHLAEYNETSIFIKLGGLLYSIKQPVDFDYRKIVEILDLDIKFKTNTDSFNYEKRYPMLECIDSWKVDNCKQKIIDYVKLVDSR
jgi:hypothetical protein